MCFLRPARGFGWLDPRLNRSAATPRVPITPAACTTETVMLPSDAAARLKNGSCEDDGPSKDTKCASAYPRLGRRAVADPFPQQRCHCIQKKRRCAAVDQWEGHPPAWPKYQTRKVWNDSQTPPRQNSPSHACRLHTRDGHAPLGRRFAAEDWDAKGLAVPTRGYETPPRASAQVALKSAPCLTKLGGVSTGWVLPGCRRGRFGFV